MALRSGTFHENYRQDMAIFRTRLQWGILFVFLIVLLTCPLFLSDRMLTLLTMIGIAIISVHGLNILTGYCGQISIGHVGFMAVGAYVSAILTAKLGWSFWTALPCAALAAGIVGLIFGLPSLKIKGFYLIMATIAAHFIIIWFILQLQNITGGADGLAVPGQAGPLSQSEIMTLQPRSWGLVCGVTSFRHSLLAVFMPVWLESF